MIKKIVVAGSRNYDNYAEAKEYINSCIDKIKAGNTLVFISGRRKGADMLGERFAQENNYKLEYYPAQRSKYVNAAGAKRNIQMAQAGDLIICFWDGKSKGTKFMIEYSKRLGKTVMIKHI